MGRRKQHRRFQLVRHRTQARSGAIGPRRLRVEPLEQRMLLSVSSGFIGDGLLAGHALQSHSEKVSRLDALMAQRTENLSELVTVPSSEALLDPAEPTEQLSPAAGDSGDGQADTAPQQWLVESVRVGVWTPERITDLPGWVRSQQWPEWMPLDLVWVEGQELDRGGPIEVRELVHIPLRVDPRGGYRTILRIDGGFRGVSVDQVLADLEQLDFVDFAKLESESVFRYTPRSQELIDALTWGNSDAVMIPAGGSIRAADRSVDVRVGLWSENAIGDVASWLESAGWPAELGALNPEEITVLASYPLRTDARGGYRTILRIDGGFRGVSVDQVLAELEQLDFVDFAKLERESVLRYTPRTQELIDATTMDAGPGEASLFGTDQVAQPAMSILMRVTLWTPERITNLRAFLESQAWPEALGPIDTDGVEQLISIPIRSEPRGGYFTIVRMPISGDISALEDVESVEHVRLESESVVRFDARVQELLDATKMDAGEGEAQLFLAESRELTDVDSFRDDQRFLDVDGAGFAVAVLDSGLDKPRSDERADVAHTSEATLSRGRSHRTPDDQQPLPNVQLDPEDIVLYDDGLETLGPHFISDLSQVYREYKAFVEEGGDPRVFQPSNKSLPAYGGRIAITIATKEPLVWQDTTDPSNPVEVRNVAFLQQLEALGFDVTAVAKYGLDAWVSIDALDELAELSGILSVTTPYGTTHTIRHVARASDQPDADDDGLLGTEPLLPKAHNVSAFDGVLAARSETAALESDSAANNVQTKAPTEMRMGIWTPDRMEDIGAWVEQQQWPEELGPVSADSVEQLVTMPLWFDPRGGYRTIITLDVYGAPAALEQLEFVDYAKLESESVIRFGPDTQEAIDALTRTGTPRERCFYAMGSAPESAPITMHVGIWTPERMEDIGAWVEQQQWPEVLGAAITGAGLAGGTSTLSGTSPTAPHAAGMAVLTQPWANQESGLSLTPARLAYLLRNTGDKIVDEPPRNAADNMENTALIPHANMYALGEAVLTLRKETRSATADDQPDTFVVERSGQNVVVELNDTVIEQLPADSPFHITLTGTNNDDTVDEGANVDLVLELWGPWEN